MRSAYYRLLPNTWHLTLAVVLLCLGANAGRKTWNNWAEQFRYDAINQKTRLPKARTPVERGQTLIRQVVQY